MNNAEAIFAGINSYQDIQNLLGRQEDVFIDFKDRDARWNKPARLSDDDKRLFSKAVSGFAHQQGGVLIWGIEARKGRDGIDEAKALKPFSKVKQFKQALEEQIKYATEPAVDGVQHKPVFVNDAEATNQGFVVSYIPKSSGVHRALGGTTNDFYKRHGDSFTPLSTEEIRSLFFRNLAPQLDLVIEKTNPTRTSTHSSWHVTFGLKNKGAGLARFACLYVGFSELQDVTAPAYWDGEGNSRYPLGRLLGAPDFYSWGKQFIVNGDIPIYPDQVLRLFVATFTMGAAGSPPPVHFKIFADGMVPREGEIG